MDTVMPDGKKSGHFGDGGQTFNERLSGGEARVWRLTYKTFLIRKGTFRIRQGQGATPLRAPTFFRCCSTFSIHVVPYADSLSQ